MKVVSMKTLLKFFNTDGDKIEKVKVTKFTHTGFNEMEGNTFDFNLKVFTTAKYANLLLNVETNGTYLEDCEEYFESEDIYNKEKVTEWLNAILDQQKERQGYKKGNTTMNYEGFTKSANNLLELMATVERLGDKPNDLLSSCDKEEQNILHHIELGDLSDTELLDNAKALKQLRTARRETKDYLAFVAKLKYLMDNDTQAFEKMQKALRCMASYKVIMDNRTYEEK